MPLTEVVPVSAEVGAAFHASMGPDHAAHLALVQTVDTGSLAVERIYPGPHHGKPFATYSDASFVLGEGTKHLDILGKIVSVANTEWEIVTVPPTDKDPERFALRGLAEYVEGEKFRLDSWHSFRQAPLSHHRAALQMAEGGIEYFQKVINEGLEFHLSDWCLPPQGRVTPTGVKIIDTDPHMRMTWSLPGMSLSNPLPGHLRRIGVWADNIHPNYKGSVTTKYKELIRTFRKKDAGGQYLMTLGASTEELIQNTNRA
jgi:hypothetical protein